MDTKTPYIDESLYSRQLYTLGKDAMGKITQTDVIVCGLKGAGIELAKCIILAGIRKVTLYEPSNKLTYNDLASNYYANPDMINDSYIESLRINLASLNSNVIVDVVYDILDLVIMKYNIAVFCDYDIHDLKQLNNVCRKANVKFIMIQTFGLSGNIFCDHGNQYTINDIDGEPLRTGIITKIQNNRFYTDEPHGLYIGDIIKFSSNKIIGEQLFLIKPISVTEFELREYKSIGENKSQTELQRETLRATHIAIKDYIPENLSFEQIKTSFQISFKTLEESLDNPEYVMFDVMDWTTHKIQHAFMRTMSIARNTLNEYDYSQMYQIFETEYTKINKEKITEDVCKIFELFYYTSMGRICGVDAVIGSIGAQEVIKASSNKFTPNKGFLHFNALDILPDNYINMRKSNPEDYIALNSRYDGQYAIFGKQYIDKMQNKKLFVVGAGAIGCEHIKNFGMMGIKNITITDMDHIENSNLNRQFLFRPTDIGQPKSITVAHKGMIMNPDIKIIAHENKICSETLNIYNSNFFRNVDIIANALDNVEARIFVDSLCVKYDKPLLESGTLGSKGNIQTIVPYLTESYGSLTDPPEKNIPVCTLKLFPYKFEHVVQYTRDLFEGYFNRISANYIKARDNICILVSMTPNDIVSIYEDITLLVNNSKKYKDCIYLAYKEWHKLYRDTIIQLIRKYPAEHIDDSGNKFWSGNKIFPSVLNFDIKTDTHIDFVIYFANIWADVLGITKRYSNENRNKYIEYLQTLDIPEEVICKDIDNTDNKLNIQYDTKTYVNMITDIINSNNNKLHDIKVIEFEKDDDTNYHIDFITNATNLRSMNYRIKTQDKLTVKGIAGKIIPAIATTTSIVSGLVSLEFYKLCYGQDNKEYNTLQRYKYGAFNLAVQTFCFGESRPAKVRMLGEDNYSIWTKEVIDQNTVFADFIDGFNECNYDIKENNNIYQLKVEYVLNESGIIYSFQANEFNSESDIELMDKTVGDVIKESLNIDKLDGDYFLTVCLERIYEDDSVYNTENENESINITCRVTV